MPCSTASSSVNSSSSIVLPQLTDVSNVLPHCHVSSSVYAVSIGSHWNCVLRRHIQPLHEQLGIFLPHWISFYEQDTAVIADAASRVPGDINEQPAAQSSGPEGWRRRLVFFAKNATRTQ
jgi:hypothetical protein